MIKNDSFPTIKDVVTIVFSYLSAHKVGQLKRVCKLWKEAANNQELWRNFMLRDFPYTNLKLNYYEQYKTKFISLAGLKKLSFVQRTRLKRPEESYYPKEAFLADAPLTTLLHGNRQWNLSVGPHQIYISLLNLDTSKVIGCWETTNSYSLSTIQIVEEYAVLLGYDRGPLWVIDMKDGAKYEIVHPGVFLCHTGDLRFYFKEFSASGVYITEHAYKNSVNKNWCQLI